ALGHHPRLQALAQALTKVDVYHDLIPDRFFQARDVGHRPVAVHDTVDQDQPGHTLRLVGRHQLRDAAADVVTSRRRLVYADRFHESHHVAGLRRDREVGVEALVGVAITEKVWGEDIKGFGQRVDDVAPEI